MAPSLSPQQVVSSLAQIRVASLSDAPPTDDNPLCCGLICGGVVVSVRANLVCVLTAAHCLDPRVPIEVRLWGGHGSGEQGRILVDSPGWASVPPESITVLRHPGFSPVTLRNDVALLVCRVPSVVAASVRPVRLPSGPDPVTASCAAPGTLNSQPAVIVGFSLTGGPASEAIPALRTAAVTIERDGWKESTTRNIAFDPRWHVWAVGSSNGAGSVVDTCEGDSGGPLLDPTGTRLIGLTSWGVSCGKANEPGVYALVCPFVGEAKEPTATRAQHTSFRRVRDSSPWRRGLAAMIENPRMLLPAERTTEPGRNAWVEDRPTFRPLSAPLEHLVAWGTLPLVLSLAALLVLAGLIVGRPRWRRTTMTAGLSLAAVIMVAMLATYC